MNPSKTIAKSQLPAVAIASLLVLGMLSTAPSQASCEEIGAEVSLEGEAGPVRDTEWKPSFRGSAFTYRNVATAISFARDAEPTYNPYYAMAFTFSPRWWVGDIFNASLDFTILREITESDWTTRDGEAAVSDLRLTLGASDFVTVPVLGIDLGASLGLVAPTSKASQARTMVIGIRPGISLSRTFPVLSGLVLSYGFSATKVFHEATTAQREEPEIAGCVGSAGGCEAYMNTGVRNASWGLSNSFALNLQLVEWLGIGASFAVIHSFLCDQEDTGIVHDEGTGIDAASGDDLGGSGESVRYSMAYGLEVAVKPIPALGIAIGAQTANPQLSPDSTYEKPFFNRYTAIYLDLTLDFGGIATSLRN